MDVFRIKFSSLRVFSTYVLYVGCHGAWTWICTSEPYQAITSVTKSRFCEARPAAHVSGYPYFGQHFREHNI
eukprot:4529908-Prymnesium_polylepis.1